MKRNRSSRTEVKRPTLRNWMALLRYLDADASSLQSMAADRATIQVYKELVANLRRLDRQQLLSLAPCLAEDSGSTKSTGEVASVKVIESLDHDALLGIVLNDETPRRELDAIATQRFHVPAGGLARMSRASLVQKICNLIDNERRHLSIRHVIKMHET